MSPRNLRTELLNMASELATIHYRLLVGNVLTADSNERRRLVTMVERLEYLADSLGIGDPSCSAIVDGVTVSFADEVKT